MRKELQNYFGCKIAMEDYKEKIPLPVFMTLREIKLVKIYETRFFLIDVTKETELLIAATQMVYLELLYQDGDRMMRWVYFCVMRIYNSHKDKMRR